MAVLELLVYPDPRLKQVAEPVTVFDGELHEFVNNLEATMDAGPGAVGIAATQVGRNQRIVIVDITSKPRFTNNGRMVLINPEVTQWQGTAIGREGCLSVPDYTGNVIRAKQIELKAQDIHGQELNFICVDYEARAVQHELDHLDGMLFIDRVVSRRNDLFRRK